MPAWSLSIPWQVKIARRGKGVALFKHPPRLTMKQRKACPSPVSILPYSPLFRPFRPSPIPALNPVSSKTARQGWKKESLGQVYHNNIPDQGSWCMALLDRLVLEPYLECKFKTNGVAI